MLQLMPDTEKLAGIINEKLGCGSISATMLAEDIISEVPVQMEAKDHLNALVSALNNAFISSAQTTAAWQHELDAAEAWLMAQKE